MYYRLSLDNHLEKQNFYFTTVHKLILHNIISVRVEEFLTRVISILMHDACKTILPTERPPPGQQSAGFSIVWMYMIILRILS